MTASLSVPDVLDAAADYIEKHGWCRHEVQNANGNVCAIGALSAAVSGDPLHWETNEQGCLVADAGEELDRVTGSACYIHWNNAVALDQADVVNHFRKAAEAARAGS